MSVILGHIGHFGHLCRIDRVEIVLVAEYGRGADVVGVYAFVGLFVRGGAYVQRQFSLGYSSLAIIQRQAS